MKDPAVGVGLGFLWSKGPSRVSRALHLAVYGHRLVASDAELLWEYGLCPSCGEALTEDERMKTGHLDCPRRSRPRGQA
jgi:hypothetical protein